jgi:hypothetical protein
MLTRLCLTRWRSGKMPDMGEAVGDPKATVGMGEVVRIESGEWQHEPFMRDYRAEWLTDVLVERATWGELESPLPIDPELGSVVVGAPGYVWGAFLVSARGMAGREILLRSGRDDRLLFAHLWSYRVS